MRIDVPQRLPIYFLGLGILLISCMLCQGLGRYSEALVFFSLLTLVGLFRPEVRAAGFVGFVSVLGFALMTALESKLSTLLPAILIICTRQTLASAPQSGNAYIASVCLLGAVLSYFLPDRDWHACLLSISACTFPIFKTRGPSDSKRSLAIASCTTVIVVSLVLVYSWTREPVGKVGIIESGQWASINNRLESLDTLDLRQLYGYSELLELIEGESLQLDSVTDAYSELWMIIPTTPLRLDQKERLLKWVENGGHLVVVTDHTDLFGHASLLNDLLATTFLQIGTDALFPQNPTANSQVSLHRDIPLKTANTEFGWFLWPVMTARWISEGADYSAKNFFGPQRATDNAKFGRRVISGAKSYGKGVITLFGDSTIFANFAIYQPGIIPFLEHLRTPKLMAYAFPWLILLSILALIFRICWHRDLLIVIAVLTGMLAIGDLRKIPINWPEFIIFSGDHEMVSEWSEPSASFSTAFAFIPLSGKKPRWSNEIFSQNKGFWLSVSTPPPSSQWTWIDPRSEPKSDHCLSNVQGEIEYALEPFLRHVTDDTPLAWDTVAWTNQPLHLGHVATNDAMGEWWLDHGASSSKKNRIQAWLALIRQQSAVKNTPCSWIRLGSKFYEYKFRKSGSDWQTITLPELIVDDSDNEVYLGRGVSARVVKTKDGEFAFLGTSGLTEGWHVAGSWILTPQH